MNLSCLLMSTLLIFFGQIGAGWISYFFFKKHRAKKRARQRNRRKSVGPGPPMQVINFLQVGKTNDGPLSIPNPDVAMETASTRKSPSQKANTSKSLQLVTPVAHAKMETVNNEFMSFK